MYEIIYHLDGGILETENPTSFAVGESVRLFEPTKQGHVFLGWNDQANGGGVYYEWLTGEKSIALYAIYAPKEYTIRYEYEGVYESEANPSFVTFGEEIALHSVIWKAIFLWVGTRRKTAGKNRKNAYRATSGSFKESDEYTIYLPSTVTEIGVEALYDCTKIYTNMSQEKMATFSSAVKNMNAVVYVDQPSFVVTLNYGDKSETPTGATRSTCRSILLFIIRQRNRTV